MTNEHLATTHRTDLCGALRAGDAGRRVRLGGWVHRARDLGGLTFVDLRDRAGLVQVSFDPRVCAADVCAAAAALGQETVVLIEGEVALRPEKIHISKAPPRSVDTGVRGRVREVAYLGDMSVYLVQIESGKTLRVTRPNVVRTPEDRIAGGEEVYLSWHASSPLVLTQ